MRSYLCLCLLAVLLAGCQEAPSLQSQEPEELIPNEPTPEVLALIEIREEIEERVLTSPLGLPKLREIYHSQDEVRIAEALGYTEEEAEELTLRFNTARAGLVEKYPAAAQEAQAKERCLSCDIDQAFDSLEGLAREKAMCKVSDECPVKCQWAPYGASLLLCTLSGPWFYFPCSYVALCSFCNGGYVTTACGG